ncbi:ribosome small subunit-dependent GTPase A [Blastococcus sp. Marseille-P5729]|uniref:ribosome small subunit-dependent GTPase A n=1 Tax=Blastococcus sp. Marseille-P5729 TaxID=2086582 RepID=UPI001F2B48D4|nr:ribosome small subunit-dependent GTPase A [Blastococcus sp. Marseille-P5729]
MRPSRRGSRPRTKTRPKHEGAEPAFVIAVDRGRYTCLVRPGLADERRILAMRAKELGRKSIVVGDSVRVVGDVSGREGSLARIVGINDRTSELRRSADDVDSFERVIVANADNLVIVCAAANPEPRTGFVDRALVAAYAGGLTPILLMTKIDLADPEPFARQYRGLGVELLLRRQDADAEQIADRLRGAVSVLFGHSGVGKSTLVNALVPDADRATGDVAGLTGKGRHTSSSAVALELPGGGFVIDTPGVRSLGLGHVEPQAVVAAFPDLVEGAEHCPSGCQHLAGEPDCALDQWVADGHSTPERLASLRRLLASRRGQHDDTADAG